jgi:hypothetical protein
MYEPTNPPNPAVRSSSDPPIPQALFSHNPVAWLTIFGPGAVMASLTIGAGELIFSSRGGAIFGYRLLWFFALVLLFKWVLVYTTARHIVLSGAHPFERWMDLPGPRGWLPVVYFLLALVCFPIWVSFHAGTVGTLLSNWAGTQESPSASAHYLWGIATLVTVLGLVFTGGYARLERLQLGIVVVMLGCVVVSLFLLKPDWWDLLKGLLIPLPLRYPDWITTQKEIAGRPVWVETITYVGIIGGSGYDYLAYVSYLRDKHWGQAGRWTATVAELDAMAGDHVHPNRLWLRAPMIDSIMSFLAVLIFTAVFVACGAILLAPQHKIPGGTNLLSLQAEFVTPIYPWLKSVYFVGAFLAIFGTLYGTIEVAPTVLRELLAAINPTGSQPNDSRLRTWSVLWVGLGGLGVLVVSLLYRWISGGQDPPGLIAILTPANLFTGVLACGFICLLNPWMDRRFFPEKLRMGWLLKVLNVGAGLIFLALGLKGYWDHSGWVAFGLLAGTMALGWIAAPVLSKALARFREG